MLKKIVWFVFPRLRPGFFCVPSEIVKESEAVFSIGNSLGHPEWKSHKNQFLVWI